MAKIQQIDFEQEKQRLLLVDLSARLPYGVKGIITYDKSNTTFIVKGIDNNVLHLSDAEECYVEDFKPYLRPMSSMTEEELKEYHKTFFYHERYDNEHKTGQNCSITFETYDWLNKHHFDYRGLIKKGLALVAPEGMYELK